MTTRSPGQPRRMVRATQPHPAGLSRGGIARVHKPSNDPQHHSEYDRRNTTCGQGDKPCRNSRAGSFVDQQSPIPVDPLHCLPLGQEQDEQDQRWSHCRKDDERGCHRFGHSTMSLARSGAFVRASGDVSCRVHTRPVRASKPKSSGKFGRGLAKLSAIRSALFASCYGPSKQPPSLRLSPTPTSAQRRDGYLASSNRRLSLCWRSSIKSLRVRRDRAARSAAIEEVAGNLGIFTLAGARGAKAPATNPAPVIGLSNRTQSNPGKATLRGDGRGH